MAKKRLKLSKSKQKWVDTKPTATMRGAPLNYPVTVERKYVAAVNKLLTQIIKDTEKEVLRIFKSPTAIEFYAEDASIASIANRKLDKLFSRLENMSRKRALATSEEMVSAANKSSQASVAFSLKELSGGVTLKTSALGGNIPEKLQAAVNSNVELITRLSSDYLGKVKDAVNRSIMSGNGLEDLIPFMRKQKGYTKRHGRLVALDQTRKAYSSLNQERMRNAGISKFEWLHSGGGQKPRKFHIDRFPKGLNGGIYDINDPPIIDPKTGVRGLPAWLPNCKCRIIPVIVLDDGEMI